MDNSSAPIVVAVIAVAGVVLSALFTYRINQVNRYKSQNEWKREKILALSSEFIDAFHHEAHAALGHDSYHPDLIKEMVLYSFNGGETEKLIYRICMLVKSNDADLILDIFRKMKEKLSADIESDYFNKADGKPKKTLYHSDNNEIIFFAKCISEIIKDMK
ncbi:hypothetical protein ACP3TB_17080 [Rahnella variigena]|uniref:hypothetical protein n=1 Tax=Rahnella variigena TaxID=574964 RepID=UPI003CF1D414